MLSKKAQKIHKEICQESMRKQQEESAVASNDVLFLPPVKKNCLSCDYLEWIDTGAEYSSGGGYCCNKRIYRSDIEEDNHLGQLEQESYLKKGKSCCEPKQR